MIRFENPGPSGRSTSTFTAEVRQALDARPGDWAVVEEGVTAGRANAWQTSGRRLGYEVTTRGTAKVRTVYARRPEVTR